MFFLSFDFLCMSLYSKFLSLYPRDPSDRAAVEANCRADCAPSIPHSVPSNFHVFRTHFIISFFFFLTLLFFHVPFRHFFFFRSLLFLLLLLRVPFLIFYISPFPHLLFPPFFFLVLFFFKFGYAAFLHLFCFIAASFKRDAWTPVVTCAWRMISG